MKDRSANPARTEVPEFGGKPLDDDELLYWAQYGSHVSSRSTPLSPSGSPARDIVTLWNLVGALTDKVLELEKGENSGS